MCEYGRVWALFMPTLHTALHKGLEPPWVLVPEGVLGPAPRMPRDSCVYVSVCIHVHVYKHLVVAFCL